MRLKTNFPLYCINLPSMSRQRKSGELFILEELLNSLTHGLGFLLSCLGMYLLVRNIPEENHVLKLICFLVYASSMVVLFASSTLYHWFHAHKHAGRWQIVDHAAIFVLIAGSYTPFSLLVLRGAWGWTIFAIIWGLAIIGIIFKLLGGRKYRRFSVFLYLLMGWLVIIAVKCLFRRC